MKTFEEYLKENNEIGFVTKQFSSLVEIQGLPRVQPGELVVFESGDVGRALTLRADAVEVILFTNNRVNAGDRVARTNSHFELMVGKGMLGTIIDPLGNVVMGEVKEHKGYEPRLVNIAPPPLMDRSMVTEQFETGVVGVDLVMPIGKGQRQLVIGDRKVGKSAFLRQTLLTHAMRGGLCVYGGVAKRQQEISAFWRFLTKYGIQVNTVAVMTNSRQPGGLIFQTPYAAMTIAEYFAGKGMDVLVIFDDLSIHAKYYREVMLTAKRFPGRSAYPGDIFYVHAKLMERAGNFTTGSITALPVAETVLSDISGYIQTNLMSMTDGHIFFDAEMYNQGRRPAVNPFLSVTRVGHQSQTPLFRSLSSELSTFLSRYRQTEELLHFGGEIGEEAKQILALGNKLTKVFNQGPASVISQNIAACVIAGLFGGFWEKDTDEVFQGRYFNLARRYAREAEFRVQVDQAMAQATDFAGLVSIVSKQQVLFLGAG
jgi:F-type H+/Na+-transporting ATPase subunit alpha